MRLPTSARLTMTIATAALLGVAAGCGGSGKDKAPESASPVPAAAAQAPSSAPPQQPSPAAGESPAPPPSQRAQAAPPDSPVPPGMDPKKPVAMVNGRPIQAEKVYSVWQMNKMMLQQRGRTLNPGEDQMLKAQSLQVVIADELLYQTAMAQHITATPADVDAEFKQWRTRVGSDDNYKSFLATSGFTEADIRHELERNFITTKYRKSLAAGQGVTEEQAKDYYAKNPDVFKVPEQAHAQYILLKCTDRDPESVRADAKSRAEEAQKKATGGEDFGALAKQYSQDATASRGGDIGFFPRGVMFPKFEEIAFALKPGEVSQVFQTPTGWNVLKLVELKPPGVRPFDEIKTQLMLEMGQMFEQNVVNAKVQELSKTARISVLDPTFAPPAQAAATPPPAPAGDHRQVPVKKAPPKP